MKPQAIRKFEYILVVLSIIVGLCIVFCSCSTVKVKETSHIKEAITKEQAILWLEENIHRHEVYTMPWSTTMYGSHEYHKMWMERYKAIIELLQEKR